jgi:diguanylate cyclase (GGDEF)-like protein/PAS domain S-box-containing protein
LSVSLVSEGYTDAPYVIAQIQDITEQRQAEERLRASEEEYRTMFELAGVGNAERDYRTGRLIRVNQKFCQITGYSSAELLAMSFADLIHPDDRAASAEMNGRLERGEITEFTTDKRYCRKDGRTVWVSLNVAAIRDNNGRVIRTVSTIQDLTERKRAEWIESDRRQVLEMVAQNMPLPGVLGRLAEAVERQVDGWAAFMIVRDGALHLHAPSFPSDWRDAVVAHLMSVAASLSSHAWDNSDRCGVSYFATDPAWNELRAPAAQLGLQSCWTMAIQSTDGSSLGALSLFCKELREPGAHDRQMLQMAASLATICVEHHNTATALAHSVRHDLLTGMPNRICFEDRIETAMQRARRDGSQVALFFLDIDRFKHVNDTFGHEAGDAMLQQFAGRLARQLREIDTLARMGGDEFALIIPDVKSPKDAIVVAEKLMRCLAEPIHVGGRDLIITTSMGIALYPCHGDDSASLQRCADQEMYRTKQRGRNGYSIAATAMAKKCVRS